MGIIRGTKERMRAWQDKRSDPTELERRDLERLNHVNPRAENIAYTSRASLLHKRFIKVASDLVLPNKARPHVTYYEPYPRMYVKERSASAIRVYAERATNVIRGLRRQQSSQFNRYSLANSLQSEIERQVLDLDALLEREKQLGRPERIVIVAMHAKDGVTPWSVAAERRIGKSKKLGTTNELVQAILNQNGENVDRIILAICNPAGEILSGITRKGLVINYVQEIIFEGYGAPNIQASWEYNAETGKTRKLTYPKKIL